LELFILKDLRFA